MEVNFLVFPAPKLTIKQEDLKELIWIPYYPNLFKTDKENANDKILGQRRSQPNNIETASYNSVQQPGEMLQNYILPHAPKSTGHTLLSNFRGSKIQSFSSTTTPHPTSNISKPFTNLFGPVPQKVLKNFDHSQTVYDDEIDEEEMGNKEITYTSPKNLILNTQKDVKNYYQLSDMCSTRNQNNNYHSVCNNYNQQNNNSTKSKTSSFRRVQIGQQEQPSKRGNSQVTTNVSVKRPASTKNSLLLYESGALQKKSIEDSYVYYYQVIYKCEPDLSMIQAEEMPLSQQPAERINKCNLMASVGKQNLTNSEMKNNQFNRLGSINVQNIFSNKIQDLHSQLKLSSNIFKSNDNLIEKLDFANKISTKKIPCLYLQPQTPSKYVGIYFHGNGEDLYQCYQLVQTIKNNLQINILVMEYPGYSFYKGKPSEEQILEDGTYIYRYLSEHSSIPEKNIFLFGRSIGTGPATYLASKFNPAMLVLISPFSSIRDVVQHSHGKMCLLIQDRFRNKDYIKKVRCHTFILHGQKDNIIPLEHSILLQNLCQGICKLHTPPHMSHIKFDFNDDLTQPLKLFMNKHGLRQVQLRLSNRFYI